MANEKRLIDANVLKEKLQAHHDFFVNAWGGFSNLPAKDKARVDEITHCIAEITNAPTVDAVEAVHGHWISKGYKIECSACGHRAFLGTHDPVIHTEEKNICKYCHNCGAKMDGGKDNE